MTQTPLQRAIEQISQYRDTYNPMCDEFTMIDNCVDKLTDLLPYERDVIEDAYSDGVNDESFGRLLGSVADNSNDYFTKTFTDNGK